MVLWLFPACDQPTTDSSDTKEPQQPRVLWAPPLINGQGGVYNGFVLVSNESGSSRIPETRVPFSRRPHPKTRYFVIAPNAPVLRTSLPSSKFAQPASRAFTVWATGRGGGWVGGFLAVTYVNMEETQKSKFTAFFFEGNQGHHRCAIHVFVLTPWAETRALRTGAATDIRTHSPPPWHAPYLLIYVSCQESLCFVYSAGDRVRCLLRPRAPLGDVVDSTI